MNIKEFTQSKKFKWILAGLAGLIVVLLSFQLGVMVGYHKANFAFRWGENYHRNFGGPRNGFFGDFRGDDFFSGHGTTGNVVKVEDSDLVIKGDDGVEKIISVNDDTLIEKGRQKIKISDIKTDDRVVVVGSPKNDGSIEGKIIRVFDPSMPPQPRPMLNPFSSSTPQTN